MWATLHTFHLKKAIIIIIESIRVGTSTIRSGKAFQENITLYQEFIPFLGSIPGESE